MKYFMTKKTIFILALLVCIGYTGFAQNPVYDVTGRVLNDTGEPISGALEIKTFTDKEGKFEIKLTESEKLKVTTSDNSYQVVEPDVDGPMTIIMGLSSQAVNIGYDKTFNLEESTSSVYSAQSNDLYHTSARDIGGTLFGNVPPMSLADV